MHTIYCNTTMLCSIIYIWYSSHAYIESDVFLYIIIYIYIGVGTMGAAGAMAPQYLLF